MIEIMKQMSVNLNGLKFRQSLTVGNHHSVILLQSIINWQLVLRNPMTPVEENIQVNNRGGDEDDSDEVEIKRPQQEEVYSALDM
ncbi:hypothetical protein PR048_011409 [Dryococelus australis]|uniref:Uncharacterized protein n=1 Tax=Dryococelus australis TaxID=614101 RepID=A0ABQ9HLI2_9NEOP|nr:hypothetical protein PR048_011409 [Dryococelus australis]